MRKCNLSKKFFDRLHFLTLNYYLYSEPKKCKELDQCIGRGAALPTVFCNLTESVPFCWKLSYPDLWLPRLSILKTGEPIDFPLQCHSSSFSFLSQCLGHILRNLVATYWMQDYEEAAAYISCDWRTRTKAVIANTRRNLWVVCTVATARTVEQEGSGVYFGRGRFSEPTIGREGVFISV